MLKSGYNFIVAGIDISYIRELNLFQAFDIETTVLARDDKYFYMEQRCAVNGKIHSYALVKAAYIQKGKAIATQDICQAFNSSLPTTLPQHISLWKESATAKRDYSEV